MTPYGQILIIEAALSTEKYTIYVIVVIKWMHALVQIVYIQD